MRKPRDVMRRSIKWIGALVTTLLLALWIGSAWYDLFIYSSSHVGTVAAGRLNIYSGSWASTRTVEVVGPRPAAIKWWFESQYDSWGVTKVTRIPIWPFAMLTGIPTVLIWRRDRRLLAAQLANSCPECGYSRVGLPSDRACPECGANPRMP